jgi:KDO2-lipid IV(A) lauroyltransferase
MQALVYYIAIPFIYFVSILPFPLLYLVSDGLYFIGFYIVGYRKKVVYTNLKNSFPEKSEKELRRLQKQYYHYLCDLVLETFKTLSIRPSKMLKRCTIKPEAGKLLDALYDENRNIILVMGHYGNWEWAGIAFSKTRKHQLFVIYHELKSKYFNKLIIKMRTRFGTKLIPMQNTIRDMMLAASDKNRPLSATAFITDQTPFPEKAYWMTFLNQDTPVFTGTEKISRKLNYPVVYVSVKKIKRGYYEIDAELLFRNPVETKDGEITDRHTKRLEKDIINLPSTWLWSHRRWKHSRKKEAQPI